MKHRRSRTASILIAMAGMVLSNGCARYHELNTDSLSVRIGSDGSVNALIDRSSGSDYLAPNVPSPLLSIRVDSVLLAPLSAQLNRTRDTMTLTFPGDRTALVSVTEAGTHLRLTLSEVTPRDAVELVVWGPYPTVLDSVIGETVGVVHGDGFAIGLQALNPKTLGGYPWNENDALPQMDIFEAGDYSDLNPEGKRGVLYRVEAAKPDTFGSTLQAYTRERDQDRVIPNRGYEAYVAPAYDDGGIIGSSIALFGSPSQEALATIGRIEVAEGLPHPMIDGIWGKQAKGAAAAYIILGFGENDLERALDITRRAGLRYLYHPDAFETWGHFALKPSYFPNGVNGMKSVVDRAAADSILVGAHMLSNFITPNDPYVTPVPDERLARVGSTTLSADISLSDRNIPIESARFFSQSQTSYLRASVIDDEIVQCGGVSEQEPWQLLDCVRGAFGTSASAHARGVSVGKLDDHGYNVFLSNASLSIEMARHVAALFNQTGLRQISFDGLEGNRSTGMGNYGEILFTQSWFDALNPAIRNHYIADASRTSHFFWHMYTRMNWGEPWYAGFRESQTEYRLKNQAYFRRNLMPGMLGWFSMRPETSVEDIEWMLARSAGFDAGYGFVTGYDQIDRNGQSDEILRLIGAWEAARMDDAFSMTQKQAMQNIDHEFHLEILGAHAWDLYPVTSLKFSHQSRERQPGEPSHSSFPFTSSPGQSQLEFILSAVGATARNITITVDGKAPLSPLVSVAEGQHLKFTGDGEAILFSSTWHAIARIPIPDEAFSLESGNHTLQFNADLGVDPEAEMKVEIRLPGTPERIETH